MLNQIPSMLRWCEQDGKPSQQQHSQQSLDSIQN